MRTRIITPIAVAALALAGCGGGSDGGGGGGRQDEVADMLLTAGDDAGFPLEESCVREATSRLSDDDAATIVEAGPGGDPDLSPEAEAVAEDLSACVDTDALVDRLVDEAGGEGVDADCLKRVLDEDGLDALETGAVVECLDLGG